MTKSDIPGITRGTAVRIIRMRELRQKLRLSPSHIYALISRGLFPAPFPLVPGGRAKGWDEAVVDAFLNSRKEAK
jgi:predicted DNA-binding transcriptional regulator AlpA